MASNQASFNVGDTVCHKAGGPTMAVHSTPTSKPGFYLCQWFAGKKLDRGSFREEELIAAAPKAPIPVPLDPSNT